MLVPTLALLLGLAAGARAQQAPDPQVCAPPGVRTSAGFVACESRCALAPEAAAPGTPLCPKRPAKSGGPFFRPLPRTGETARGLEDAEKKIGQIKAAGFDGQTDEPEKDGVETTVEPMAGVIHAGRLKAPAFGAAVQSELTKGPWSAEVAAEGLWARGLTGAVAGNYSAEAGVGHRLGDSRVKAIVEAEAERDEFLGVRGAAAMRAGLEADVLDSKRQSLGVAVGVGPNQERHFGGETESFISPAVAVDYALTLLPRLKVGQKLEGEFNAKTPGDVEVKSVTEVVWELSRKAALRLSHTIKKRSEAVDGFPSSRETTQLSLIIHP